MIVLAALLLLFGGQDSPPASVDETALAARVQAYYVAQAQKNPDGLLALWSASAASRPTSESLRRLFDAGDDVFDGVAIRKVVVSGNGATVRVSGVRVRTVILGGQAARTFRTPFVSALTWVREEGTWKLTADQPAIEEFADRLVAAPVTDRARLLSEEPDLVDSSLRRSIASRAARMAIAQQSRQAQTLFELALDVARAANDREGESEMLQNLANAHYFLREFSRALEYYEARLTLARGLHDHDATAASLLGVATIRYSKGDYTPALLAYREALGIYETAGATGSIGSTLISVANVQFLQGDYDAAAAGYRRAFALLRQAMNLPGAAMALAGMGRVLAAQGDIAAALDTYGQVLADARRRADRLDTANSLESIGELHYRLGNVDAARAAFTDAQRLSDEVNDPAGAGRLLGDLGLTELRAGRFAAALAAYVESRGRFERAQRADGVARAWVGVGFAQTARERYAEAISAYRTAIARFEESNQQEEAGRAWLGLSLAETGAGDSPAALASARRVRAIADGIGNADLRWRAEVRSGEALRSLKRLDDAKASFEQAIQDIQRIAASAALDADARGQLQESGSAWVGLAFTLADRGDAAGALIADEQRRAHLRRLLLSAHERDIVRRATPAELDEEQQIVRDLLSARAQLRAERAAPSPDRARTDHLRQAIGDLIARREAQQAQLYSRLPDLRLWRGLAPSPSAADLDAMVADSGTLIVEYVLGDREVLVLTASHGEGGLDATSAVVTLKRQDLAAACGQALEVASLQDADEWRKRSRVLSDVLVAPIAARLAGRRHVILLPDDLLWKVPFEALRVGDADLATRMSVSYATALSTLMVQQHATPPLSARPTFAAIAAPDISQGLREQLALTVPGWVPPDPATAIENARLARMAYGEDARTLTGAGATEPAARELERVVDVLDVEAPLQISSASPLFSSVLLAGTGETRETDGRWEARDWFSSSRSAPILALTDGSSLGSAGAGSALDAIAWAAAAGGTRAIVLGRWPVEAFTNSGLAAAFHQRLGSTDEKPVDVIGAMTAAIKSVREHDGAAPRAWAGMRVIGG